MQDPRPIFKDKATPKPQKPDGFILLLNDDQNLVSIPAHNVRSLVQSGPRTLLSLAHAQDKQYHFRTGYLINADVILATEILKLARAGKDIDLRPFSGPHGRRLESWPPQEGYNKTNRASEDIAQELKEKKRKNYHDRLQKMSMEQARIWRF